MAKFLGHKETLPTESISSSDQLEASRSKTDYGISAPRTPTQSQSQFGSLDWGSQSGSASRTTFNSRAYKTSHTHSVDSSNFARMYALSPSPASISFSSCPGSAEKPIELDYADDFYEYRCANPGQGLNMSEFCNPSENSLEGTETCSVGDEQEVLDSACEDMTNVLSQLPTRKDSMRRYSVADSDVVELDDWKDLEIENGIQSGVEIICLEDVYSEDRASQIREKVVKVAKYERRNPSIAMPFELLSDHRLRNMQLKPNKTVELEDGSFLRIKSIIRNSQTQKVRLRGHRLQRARHLNGLLGSKVNESLMFLEVDLDDPRDPLEQGAIEIPLKDVVKLRCARFTNRKFPDCRAISTQQYRSKLEAAEFGGLTVRWRYTCKYASAADRYHNIFKERILERIRPEDCRPAHALPDELRRFQWRGETIRGGSSQPMTDVKELHRLPTEEELLKVDSSGSTKRKLSNSVEESDMPKLKRKRHNEQEVEETRRKMSDVTLEEPIQQQRVIDLTDSETEKSLSITNSRHIDSIPNIIDLTSSTISEIPPTGSIFITTSKPPSPIHRTACQAFTYGDAFCGAGGSTRGALQAGLRPKWGFDFAPHACASWRANFPSATCYNIEAHSFVSHASRPANMATFKVDILHLSPPCQYFSPAHTVNGVDDEQNVASLFAVEEVIKVARPRVVTLEQTFGIACSRFRWYFNSMIQMFTSQDFSVRWAVVPLAQWGLPQRRNRLIIIASCPGETLPRMPLPTHSSTDPSLLPLVSASSTLLSIPANAPDHNPTSPSLEYTPDRQKTPWDDSKILPRAITTSGGQNYHPSGKRDLTLREYACLQGFPLEHVFKGTHVKKQIGNAVPPCVAKVLFESVRRDLEEADRIIAGIEMVE